MKTPAGVPLTEVRSLAEDPSGAIWAATWGNGVVRLGPTEWFWLKEANGLAGDWTRDLTVGRDGTIWIATADGLCVFRPSGLECYTTADFSTLPSDDLVSVVATSGGDILLGTRAGINYVLHGASDDSSGIFEEPERWQQLTAPSPDAGIRMRLASALPDWAGSVLISFRGGDLSEYSEGELQPLMGPGYGLHLGGTLNGELWAGQWNGYSIYKYADGVWRSAGALPDLINVVRPLSDGHVYAGTYAGLYASGRNGFEEVALGDNVGRPHISCMLEASDGALWLGCQEGLVRGSLSTWQNFAQSNDGEQLVNLVPDPQGEGLLALGTANGVARFTGTAWETQLRLDTDEPLGYLESAAGEPYLWAFGSGDVLQFSLEDGGILSRTPAPHSDVDRKLFHTRAGETWFLSRDGVFAFEDGAWAPRPVVPGYARRQVYSVAEVEPGTFYVGLMNGIERWGADGVQFFGAVDGLEAGDATYTICPMSDGSIWFGTFGTGINVLEEGSFRNIGVADGLAHHSVSNILETRDGVVWVTYRRAGIAAFQDGRWMSFGMANGLPNASILGLFEDASGQLWLQSRGEGLYRFRRNTTAPETRLEGATFEVSPSGIGVFSFSATDGWQATPDHALLYSRQLIARPSGRVIEPWSAFSTRSTYITPSLEPGAYAIEVRASDDAWNVDPSPEVVAFRVHPHIWRQSGVYVPAIVLAVLLLIAVALRVHANRDLRRSKAALSQSNRQLMNEIRERLLAEQRLNEHFEQLEEIVRARTADLESAQRALVQQERLAMLGKVTGSVSHELRNPLGTLRSTLFIIGRRVQGLDLGLEEALERAERSIKRCDRIIEEFLDFSRTESMDRETVDMDAWLRATMEEMELPDEVAKIFTYESATTLALDPERLRRAVVNVVNNAVQAMAETPERPQRLRVKSRIRESRFEIVVKDSGPGIPEESLARVLEPLYSTKGFGVGLGMPIVKDIMEKHGGGVEYDSVVDKGTTVVLWIPVPAGQEPPLS